MGREGVAKGLCGGCSESHITTDDRGDQLVMCRAAWHHPRVVSRVIVNCNSFEPRHTGMDRDEAFRIGWVLEVKKGGPVGFGGVPALEYELVPPKKKNEDE